MCRAGWSVLTEVEGVAHAHQLQACCCIQMTQQAVVGLVRNGGLADGAWCPAPQTGILQQASTTHVVCTSDNVNSPCEECKVWSQVSR